MKRIILFLIVIFSSINLFGQDTTEQFVTTEGFYGKGWEYSGFMEIQNNKVFKTGWLKFNDSLIIPDSIRNLLAEIPNRTHIYLKIEAIKRSSGHYGHLGGADVEFEVIRIIEIDTSYTISEFLSTRKE